NERPRHDRTLREMAKKLNLTSRYILESRDLLSGLNLQDPVHHDEGKSLLQETFYFLEIHRHVRSPQRRRSTVATARGIKRAPAGGVLASEISRVTLSPTSSAIFNGSLS